MASGLPRTFILPPTLEVGPMVTLLLLLLLLLLLPLLLLLLLLFSVSGPEVPSLPSTGLALVVVDV